MNEERFRELARQAGILIDWGEDIKVGRWGIGGTYKNMQKFAEVVARECMSYMEDGDIDFAKFMIKKNFGVE
jgi:hypothetical protein